ncbi:hypothetical protein ATANTOWER_029771 [Ataeniobius toweri]|uniref:Uncharacterized protein n=1 Tax=Ataeniobius toweri TaxID=208326 RepID=A0ABU7C437_9TELE|nr:hypothetical protein [Ataeniobius toweri]
MKKLRKIIRSDHLATDPWISKFLSSMSCSAECWKQLPATPVRAQLKDSHSRITQRECQLCESLCQSSCQTQPQWGKRISSNKPSSTTNTERWKIKTRMM